VGRRNKVRPRDVNNDLEGLSIERTGSADTAGAEEKAGFYFTSSRAIIDACKPYDWIREFPPTNVASPELRRKVLDKWKELF
jgi:hypothetical protein